MHQRLIGCYAHIVDDHGTKSKNGVRDMSKFVVSFQKAVMEMKPTIECYLGPNPVLYWNVYTDFLDHTVAEFTSTFEKLSPIGEDMCQRVFF